MLKNLTSLLRDVARVAAARGLALVLVTLTHVLVARKLGPQGRGDFVYLYTFALTVYQFCALGLQTSQTVQLARNRELFPQLARNSTLISLGLGGAAGLLASAVLSTSWAGPGVWVAGLLVPGLLFYVLASNLVLAEGNLGRYNLISVLHDLAIFLGLAGALVIAPTPTSCLLGVLVAKTVFNLALWAGLPGPPPRAYDWPLFRDGWSLAWRSYVACVLTFLTYRLSIYVLGSQASPAEIGYFSVATQLFDICLMLPSLTAAVLLPRLCQRSPEEGLRLCMATLGTAVGALGLGLALLTPLLPMLIAAVFGPDYLPAASACRLIMPAILCWTVSALLSPFFSSFGRPLAYLGCWLLTLLATLGLSLWLTPRYQAAGAAAALSLASLILPVGQLYLIRRRTA
jgi:O-antigen/teichoic acid export membrane protein